MKAPRASVCWASNFVLTLCLSLVASRRHTAGGHLEVNRGFADADQRGAAILDALQIDAVARHAGRFVELLALADQCALVVLCSGHLRVGRQRRGKEARAEETEGEHQAPVTRRLNLR